MAILFQASASVIVWNRLYDNFSSAGIDTLRWQVAGSSVLGSGTGVDTKGGNLVMNNIMNGGAGGNNFNNLSVSTLSSTQKVKLLNITLSYFNLTSDNGGTGGTSRYGEAYLSLVVGNGTFSTLIADKELNISFGAAGSPIYTAVYNDWGDPGIYYLKHTDPYNWTWGNTTTVFRTFNATAIPENGNLTLFLRTRSKSDDGNLIINATFLADNVYLDAEEIFAIQQNPVNNSFIGDSILNATIYTRSITGLNISFFVWDASGNLVFSGFNTTSTLGGLFNNIRNSTSVNATGLTTGGYKWNILACGTNATSDTVCTTSDYGNYSFIYGLSIVNVSYNPSTVEGATELFSINLSIASASANVDGVLVYNGTRYSALSSGTGSSRLLSKTIVIPNVAASTNLSFYWELNISQTTLATTSLYTQQVNSLGIDSCTSFTNKILNFTVYDEETQIFIPNASIESALNVYSLDRSQIILNISNIKNSSSSFCLSNSLLNTTSYLLDAQIKYSADGYASEYYNLIDYNLSSSTTQRNISLYDLNFSDSTIFQFSFSDINFLPVEGAQVFLERQYLSENTFKTVELPITDSSGKTILHIVKNDVIYNIRVVKNGEVLGNFERIIGFCQDFTVGSCRIDLTASSSALPVFNYTSFVGLIFTAPSYNANTSVVSSQFITPDGNVHTILMEVTRSDSFGNRSLCTNTLVSSSGSLSCAINPNITSTSIIVTLYSDGFPVSTILVGITSSPYGSLGYTAWFFLTLILIIGFGDYKNGVLISLLVSFVGAVTLGFTNGTIFGVTAAGIWIIVIIILGIWRLNRDKFQ